jgi:glycosyl transferase, family 25
LGVEKKFLTVFINLASDVARRQTMEAQLERLGLLYARQEAVLGAAIPQEIASHFYDKNSNLTCSLRKGEVGCFASHLLVSQRIFTGEWPEPVLVLEDDQIAPEDVVELIEEILTKLPADWDIVRLSDNLKCAYFVDKPLRGGRSLVRYSKIPRGAGAYLINRSGAEKLLRLRPADLSFDVELVHCWNIDLSTYGVAPPPFRPASTASTIDSIDAGRLQGIRRLSLRRAGLATLPKRLRYNIRRLGLAGWTAGVAANTHNHIVKALGLRNRIVLALQR